MSDALTIEPEIAKKAEKQAIHPDGTRVYTSERRVIDIQGGIVRCTRYCGDYTVVQMFTLEMLNDVQVKADDVVAWFSGEECNLEAYFAREIAKAFEQDQSVR